MTKVATTREILMVITIIEIAIIIETAIISEDVDYPLLVGNRPDPPVETENDAPKRTEPTAHNPVGVAVENPHASQRQHQYAQKAWFCRVRIPGPVQWAKPPVTSMSKADQNGYNAPSKSKLLIHLFSLNI